MSTSGTPEHSRRRHDVRLGRLRRRAALASALGFVAFLGLAAQHAVGSTKRAVRTAAPTPAAVPARYFDDQGDGYAFDDGSAEPLAAPVAQTSVS